MSATTFAQAGRAATAAERQFLTSVRDRIAAILPPATAGWKVTHSDAATDVPDRVLSAPGQPLPYTFLWNMERGERPGNGKNADPQDVLGQLEALSKKIDAAMEKGDMATVQKLSSELAALTAQTSGVVDRARENAGYSKDELPALLQDVLVAISIEVNARSVAVPGNAVAIAGPAGAKLVFRVPPASGGNRNETETLVFVGAWSGAAGGTATATFAAGTTSASVQSVFMKIQAEPARADSILKSVKFQDMAGWLR